jgi:hypothetical protein
VDLRTVFCLEEQCTVGNDRVIRYKNRFFQIGAQSNLPPAREKVWIQEPLEGTIHLVYKERELLFMEINELPRKTSKAYQKQQSHWLRKNYVPAVDLPLEKI